MSEGRATFVTFPADIENNPKSIIRVLRRVVEQVNIIRGVTGVIKEPSATIEDFQQKSVSTVGSEKSLTTLESRISALESKVKILEGA